MYELCYSIICDFNDCKFYPYFQDEGWEDDEEDAAGDVQLSGQTLSSLLDEFTNEFSAFTDDTEEEEDDPDALNDPVNQIELLVS